MIKPVPVSHPISSVRFYSQRPNANSEHFPRRVHRASRQCLLFGVSVSPGRLFSVLARTRDERSITTIGLHLD
jgi:hypothetical protein